MARRRRATLNLSAEQGRDVLAFLVHEGVLRAAQIQRAFQRRQRLVRELKARLVALGEAGTMAVDQASRAATREWRASRPVRKKATSETRRAAMRMQGRYLAAIRQLSKEARKQVKAIRSKSGVKAAIATAKRMTERR